MAVKIGEKEIMEKYNIMEILDTKENEEKIEIGGRVLVFSGNTKHILGKGTVIGSEEIEFPDGKISIPVIKLDSGAEITGAECWWIRIRERGEGISGKLKYILMQIIDLLQELDDIVIEHSDTCPCNRCEKYRELKRMLENEG